MGFENLNEHIYACEAAFTLVVYYCVYNLFLGRFHEEPSAFELAAWPLLHEAHRRRAGVVAAGGGADGARRRAGAGLQRRACVLWRIPLSRASRQPATGKTRDY